MANHYTNKVTCFACNYNCQLINGSAEPIYHCNLKKAISWPDNNIYFREGLHHLLFREETRIFCRGHIFLDFSLYNIRYFTNRDWIQLLKSLGLKVIIICDPIMAPLAAFWYLQESIIYTILFAKNVFNELGSISTYPASKYITKENTSIKALNNLEFKFISLILNGNSIKRISTILNVNLKKSYNIYQSICRKMGVDLKLILRLHC